MAWWPSWLRHWILNPEIAGSSPVHATNSSPSMELSRYIKQEVSEMKYLRVLVLVFILFMLNGCVTLKPLVKDFLKADAPKTNDRIDMTDPIMSLQAQEDYWEARRVKYLVKVSYTIKF
jgi:hypothetical protein